MNQKGFSQFLLIIIAGAILVIGGGGFWYYQQSAKPSNESVLEAQVTPEPSSSEIPSTLTEPLELPKQQAPTIPAPTATQSPAPKAAPKPTPPPATAPAPSPQAVAPQTTPSETCTRSFSPKFGASPYYTGSLFDAHIHLPGAPEIKKLVCTFDKEKVKGAIGFYWSPSQSQTLEKMLTEAESIKNDGN